MGIRYKHSTYVGSPYKQKNCGTTNQCNLHTYIRTWYKPKISHMGRPWGCVLFSPEVNVKHYHTSTRKQKLCCKMNQIPANFNDATTGHKLQGMSKDIIIVSSWPTGGLSLMFKNCEYVVLSRVRTLSGLYLVEPIDMDKSFNPSLQLRSYMERAMRKEKEILEKRRIAMSQIIW